MYTANSYELSDRGTWYGASAEMEQFRLYIQKESSLAKHAGMQVMEMVQKKYPSERYYDKRSHLKCPDR